MSVQASLTAESTVLHATISFSVRVVLRDEDLIGFVAVVKSDHLLLESCKVKAWTLVRPKPDGNETKLIPQI